MRAQVSGERLLSFVLSADGGTLLTGSADGALVARRAHDLMPDEGLTSSSGGGGGGSGSGSGGGGISGMGEGAPQHGLGLSMEGAGMEPGEDVSSVLVSEPAPREQRQRRQAQQLQLQRPRRRPSMLLSNTDAGAGSAAELAPSSLMGRPHHMVLPATRGAQGNAGGAHAHRTAAEMRRARVAADAAAATAAVVTAVTAPPGIVGADAQRRSCLGAPVTALALTGGAAEHHLLGGTADGELALVGLQAEARSEEVRMDGCAVATPAAALATLVSLAR